MTPLDLWHECRDRGIELIVAEGKLTYEAPAGAVSELLPAMKQNRDALMDCVKFLDGSPFADGPYWSWGPYLTQDELDRWRRDLFEVVDELARLKGWRDEDYDLIVEAIDRQPISTLRPDLHHFRARLDKARGGSYKEAT